jgi:hypothetical protein
MSARIMDALQLQPAELPRLEQHLATARAYVEAWKAAGLSYTPETGEALRNARDAFRACIPGQLMTGDRIGWIHLAYIVAESRAFDDVSDLPRERLVEAREAMVRAQRALAEVVAVLTSAAQSHRVDVARCDARLHLARGQYLMCTGERGHPGRHHMPFGENQVRTWDDAPAGTITTSPSPAVATIRSCGAELFSGSKTRCTLPMGHALPHVCAGVNAAGIAWSTDHSAGDPDA